MPAECFRLLSISFAIPSPESWASKQQFAKSWWTGTRFDARSQADWSQITGATLDERIGKWLYADRFAEVTDTVFLGQGERAILEFVPKHPGKFLFHAHQSEFLELGWTGLFEVT